MPLISQEIIKAYASSDAELIVIVDVLFGVRLYAYYVITLDKFQDGDIEGTLMTPPFEIYGPFADYAEARIMAESLDEP